MNHLINNESKDIKTFLNNEFKSIESQTKSIICNIHPDGNDRLLQDFKDCKLPPDEFEKKICNFTDVMFKSHKEIPDFVVID